MDRTRDHDGRCAECGRELDDTDWAYIDNGETVGAECCADA